MLETIRALLYQIMASAGMAVMLTMIVFILIFMLAAAATNHDR